MVSYFKKITKVEGERGKFKGLVDMMKRERKALCKRREDLSS